MSNQIDQVLSGKIKISARVTGFISYLHYENGLPIVRGLSISSIDGKTYNDVSLRIDLISGTTKFAETLDIKLDEITPATRNQEVSLKLLPQLFASIKSNQLADMTLEMFLGDESLGSVTISTELYPLNSWRTTGDDKFDGLLLSAFSQPSDPAIPQILSAARKIKTKIISPQGHPYGPDTSGYQGDADEVEAEARAIYEAIQELGLEYSNPFPNFNLQGQPIRTVSEILKDKSATCLDTAMMMASCLEAIRLSPIVVTVYGHAYVGVWKVRGHLDTPVMNLLDIAGLEAAGLIVFFETTTLCPGSSKVSFFDSKVGVTRYIEPNYRFKKNGKEIPEELDVRLAIDVVYARYEESIRPIPTVTFTKSGEVSIQQSELPKLEFNFTGTTSTPKISLRDDNAPTRVKIWKTSLLDLSFRNPLLNRGIRASAQIAVPQGKLGQIEDLLQIPSSSLSIRAVDRSNKLGLRSNLSEEENSIATVELVTHNGLIVTGGEREGTNLLRKLAGSSKASIQETGTNNLYMTFGSLTWDRDPQSPSAGQATSPLFLLPVTLKSVGRDSFTIQLDDTEEATPNETLALKLAEQGIQIPLLSNPELDAAGFDIDGLIQQVRQQVNVVHKKANWVVAEDATIGTFDFSSFHMWKDLQTNWATLAKVPLVKHLIETDGTKPFIDEKTPNTDFTGAELDAEIEKLPLPSDETQVKAILKSLAGSSFVIQGPPGTGKSQTISNLLARNLQEGKRVLFMSEKPAALAVVKTRLDAIGLGAFVLDLHDKGTKPANIRNQLLEALDANPGKDESGLGAAAAEYDTALRTLATYPAKLHKVDSKYGFSVYSSRDKLLLVPGISKLSLSRKVVNELFGESYAKFLSALKDIPELGQVAGNYQSNNWSFATVNPEALRSEVKDKLKDELRVLAKLVDKISSSHPLKAVLDNVVTLDELSRFGSLEGTQIPSSNELALGRSAENSLVRHELKKAIEKLNSVIGKSSIFQEHLAGLDVQAMEAKIQEAHSAKLFKGKKLDAVAVELGGYLNQGVLRQNLDDSFKAAKELKALVVKVCALADKTVGLAEISEEDLYTTDGISALEQGISKLESVLELTDSNKSKSAKFVLESIHSGITDGLVDLGSIGLLVSAIFQSLEVQEYSLNGWLGSRTLGQAIASEAEKWAEDAVDEGFRKLVRWGKVLDVLQPLFRTEQLTAIDEILSGKVKYDEVPSAFERAYLELLFEKLLDDNDLHHFDGVSHDAKIKQLDSAINVLRKHNRGAIASEVVSARGFDASATVGVSGALRAELTKQKGGLPVRALMHKFWNTITQVAPLVAASPDSVARFLNVDTAKFDLVVFDEASQIRVATAIGALGRAKQAIIVGDSKQMPPSVSVGSHDGQVELNEDDYFNLNDQESILSMAEVSQIPAVMLSWHYRSQDEILIAFSNKEIYEGKLSSFPSPRFKEQPLSERKLKFEYAKENYYSPSTKRSKGDAAAVADTDVTTASGTNLKEATRVVKAIQKLSKDSKGKAVSLGVITMNEQQRNLIETMLRDLEDDTINRLMNQEVYPEDYIFVRALEKVQGDERDTILFSIGFAKPNKEAKMSMKFGPLTRSGSERRLNVAVTRARKEMIVFCSFSPSEFVVQETSVKGMRLMKKFLEFAELGNQELSTTTTYELDDRHRADVAEALRSSGLKVKENVGLSNFRVDIAVADPEDDSKCIVAVMLDGRGWQSRSTSHDREVLPKTVLENNMDWPRVERIWLPMWISNRDGEVNRIRQAIDAIQASRKLKESLPEEPIDEDTDSLFDVSDLMGMAEENFVEEAPPAKSSPNALGVNIDEIPHFVNLREKVLVDDKRYIQHLYHPEVVKIVEHVVSQLTETEGPVSEKRATTFVAKCFGLASVQAARQAEILDAISSSKFKRDKEGFIFPSGVDPKKYREWRKQTDHASRPLANISLVEIANAMATICSKTAGMDTAQLAKQVSIAFGVTKLTSVADARIKSAEVFGVKNGILSEKDGLVTSLI